MQLEKTFSKIQSRSVKAIKYNPDTRELDIQFNTGKWYRYKGVAVAVWEAMLASTEIGTFVSQHIKGQYMYKMI
jgi:hypothetical protein